jgi:hypothetical protein
VQYIFASLYYYFHQVSHDHHYFYYYYPSPHIYPYSPSSYYRCSFGGSFKLWIGTWNVWMRERDTACY